MLEYIGDYQSLPTGVAILPTLTSLQTKPKEPSVGNVIALPNLTTLGEATDQLPNAYQTLPVLTVRSVGPTTWHIVPDPVTLYTIGTVAMAW